MDGCHIVAAKQCDWQSFLSLAGEEGWRVPDNEIAFHRRPGMCSAFALRHTGRSIGFVTAVRHQKSGWIGNLIVAPAQRGSGHGAHLFDAAVATLLSQGTQSLWLTASAQGAPLYLRRGFQPRGRVCRWVRRQGGAGQQLRIAGSLATGMLADRAVWQESRQDLLAHLATKGLWLANEAGVALLQHDKDRQILGPWLISATSNDVRPLLEAAVAAATPGKELVVDLVNSRPETEKILLHEKFTSVGETVLMAAGQAQDVRLQRMLSLASLGSIG